MDTTEIFVAITGLLLIVGTLWFFFGAEYKSSRSASAGGESADHAASGQPTTAEPYACPMHPWITSSDPAATCSICGMKLVRE
jgi:hypothetical protein